MACDRSEMHVSDAIIMRVREFGESDLLVTCFTEDMGRIKGVAKGGKRSKKRFANCLDLLCHVRLEYGLKGTGDLYLLNSCRLIHAFPGIRTDFQALALASYMMELADLFSPQSIVEPEVFKLLHQALLGLEKGMRKDVLRIIFETRIMTIGGYKIDFDRCVKCGRKYTGAGRAVFCPDRGCIACLNCENETRQKPGMDPEVVKTLAALQSSPWDGIDNLLFTETDIKEVRQVLRSHMDYRIGKRPKTTKYLE